MLTDFYLTRFPTAKREFQNRFETCSRYSHTYELNKKKVKEKKKHDVEASMKYAVNLMFTKMQATQGFDLFGKRVVVAMIKELKKLQGVPMPGKNL